MDNFMNHVKEYGLKAAFNGAAMGIGSILLFGDGNVNLLNMNVPSYVPVGLAGVASSLVGDAAHDYILPHIPQSEKLMNAESLGLNFITSGAAFSLALKGTTGLPNQNIPKAVGFGGTFKLAADAGYEKLFEGPNKIF